jgi:glycosyltransferase involved in cell wall biosynthesis
MKTIEIVIATYNGEEFLDEQLRSILAQTYRPQQIVVIDDSSQDDTKKSTKAEFFARRSYAIKSL